MSGTAASSNGEALLILTTLMRSRLRGSTNRELAAELEYAKYHMDQRFPGLDFADPLRIMVLGAVTTAVEAMRLASTAGWGREQAEAFLEEFLDKMALQVLVSSSGHGEQR